MLKKQAQVLESRTFGTASDSEVLEYEIRRDLVYNLCNELACSISK
jgi:hypothetical protein